MECNMFSRIADYVVATRGIRVSISVLHSPPTINPKS